MAQVGLLGQVLGLCLALRKACGSCSPVAVNFCYYSLSSEDCPGDVGTISLSFSVWSLALVQEKLRVVEEPL